MRTFKFQILTVLALLAVLAAGNVRATEPVPFSYEYGPEVFSEAGTVNGCGASFRAAWTNGANETIGTTGSMEFFLVTEPPGTAATMRIAGVVNDAQKPVTTAWISGRSYGKTAGFERDPDAEVGTYFAEKRNDSKAIILIRSMVRDGAAISMRFDGRIADEAVQIPPAPPSVTAAVERCLSVLSERMGGQPALH